MAKKCESNHKNSRLWETERGPVRRCVECGAIRKLKGADLQQVKKDK